MLTNQPPYSIDQQIASLETRGMTLNKSHTEETLRSISYFRLKSYWWDMKDHTTNKFLPNASFQLAFERYQFDKALRIILFAAIETIEIALRTKLINHFSAGTNGLWYLDTSLFRDLTLHQDHILTLKREFNRSKDPIVIQYIRDHRANWYKNRLDGDNPDAWFIFEYASFGTLSKIYENIKPNHPVRSAIANEFGLYISSDFSSWLKAITELRNIIAHHSRLWNRKLSLLPATPSRMPKPWLFTTIPPQIKSQPYCVITNTIYLCNVIQPKNQIKERILKLIDDNPQIDITKYGFVGEWRKEPIWRISLKRRFVHWLLKYVHI